MSFNTFGKIFRFTTWGESHGPAIGCVVDGCPPNIKINIDEITDFFYHSFGIISQIFQPNNHHVKIIFSKIS